ncbi:NAD(P)/FAD-dependent oxidoreductase [Butyrivibrio sp. LB2008]|uniref:NAD(P)/FAD-dependent oxidoreductase n=1 Tax=Butyrivibrio sp. LB2008 TaxID=1408305 RepID=UPI00047B3A33|nr:FAD-dependent oxidoreductase [Butyrivibrio sp. LB2008]
MIRINQIKLLNDGKNVREHDELCDVLKKKAAKLLRITENEISEFVIMRHSIDARKKPQIYDVFMVDLRLAKAKDKKAEEKIVSKIKDKGISVVSPVFYDFMEKAGVIGELPSGATDKRIAVIGSGPAGLFCAYMLAEAGFKPVVFERGADVDKRQEIVEKFWETGELDTRTNVQFGEGGAGTFSDGKLNTMVKDKDGRGRKALSLFTTFGADSKIMYDAKPHIGTDVLRNVVKNMRQEIISLGGEFRFETQVTDIVTDGSGALKALVADGEEIPFDMAVLAIGHSARDTFSMLKERDVSMQKKPFAVGFRVEHPQKLINLSQYGIEDPKSLPVSSYKLVMNTKEGRGVYSFCMCPGGFVVNASSEEGRLAVNGMSYSKRDSENANSAIIITVDPKDFGSEDVLAGVEFQRRLEEKAYKLGNGKIPVEYYEDFKNAVDKDGAFNSDSDLDLDKETVRFRDSFHPNTKGAYSFTNVHEILPDDLNKSFVEGMEKFGTMIKGYNSPDALIAGVETRTSSPVRINRTENGESENVKGLFPCGEGAGYAGGIMSAAMDGIKIAELIVKNIVESFD